MKQRISGKQAAHVAEDVASRGPVRLVASDDVQEAQAAALPAACTPLGGMQKFKDQPMDHRQAIRLQTSGRHAAVARRKIDHSSDLNANPLYQLQENIIIAALRRPSLGSIIKGAGVSERHFPVELRPAFQIAMTKSQEEIRRLVMLKDPHIWPLYGKRIIEWSDGQMRKVARQLADSPWSIEDLYPVSAVQSNNGSKSTARPDHSGP